MDKQDLELRFWSKAEPESATKCRNWLYHKNNKGYGVFHLEGKVVLAHRLAYKLTKGEIPEGMNVCHRCDNTACINPFHLFLGTQKENLKDRDKKGRAVLGEARSQSKLTWSKVRQIRAMKGLYSQREIAKAIGISQAIVCDVMNNKRWKE